MEIKVSKILSVVFHPLLIPTYTLLIIFNLNVFFSMIIPQLAKWQILGMVFLITFLFPLFMMILFQRIGIIKSLYMKTKEERTLPYLMTIIFYYLASYLLKQLQISPIFYYFILGATFLIIITLIINFFWKISIHMIGIGGMLGTLIGLSFLWMIDIPFLIILLILCSGITGFARLKLNAHNPVQVYTGFVIGTSFMLLLFLVISYY
ncbi:MAG: hypothetical protein KAV44_08555 [Bacteroidales bacterium]|jgi:hypothetical protein|nr:hypothetical protein [Bacteroidales bacterium]